ncbi:MAG TPA: hypothetical protein VIV61_17730 [Candidatus Ozemobacteraceae bacterium]
MDNEWLEKNRRALIGIAIFGILLLLNLVVRLNRPRPAAVLLTPPGATVPAQPDVSAVSPAPLTVSVPSAPLTPVQVPAPSDVPAQAALPVMIDPTQPIAQQLSGIAARLTDLETRLATLAAPLTRPVPGRAAVPERDLFHWPGSVPVSSGPVSIIASGGAAPAPKTQTLIYLGTITRGEKAFVFLRVDSRAYLLGENADLPGTPYRIGRISSTSADIISVDGSVKKISRETSSEEKIRSIASILKEGGTSSTLEMRWLPPEKPVTQSSETIPVFDLPHQSMSELNEMTPASTSR